MSERRTISERLTSAFQSSDLSLDANRRGDVDHLIALGYADQRTGGVGGALMRMHMIGGPGDQSSALDAVTALTKRIARQQRWDLGGPEIRHVAKLALAHQAHPSCPHCMGRKFELVPGTPTLSAKACVPCDGTGKRKVQRHWNREIRAVLSALDQIESVTEQAVVRLLR